MLVLTFLCGSFTSLIFYFIVRTNSCTFGFVQVEAL